jgi:hypothetical protein
LKTAGETHSPARLPESEELYDQCGIGLFENDGFFNGKPPYPIASCFLKFRQPNSPRVQTIAMNGSKM